MTLSNRLLAGSLIVAGIGFTAVSANAAIYGISDFTRPANAASTASHMDFVPNAGWTNTPPNAISGEDSVYLKFTLSWAATTDIGTFDVRFYVNDGGVASRWGVRTATTNSTSQGGSNTFGFGMTGNNYNLTDPDGAGPATAAPAVAAVNKTTTTTATFVLKVDQTKPTPGGDWWFAALGQQSGAGAFLWINPNLGADETSQPTNIAQWRSGNGSYAGVSFITDTALVDLNFSNIAVYTGSDTPFAVPEPASLAFLSLGGLVLGRRRRS